MDDEPQAAEPILVATLPSDVSATEYACIDLCAETNKEWPAENVCVWYRRCPGAATEVFAMQEACPHARISLMESDIEDFRSTDLGASASLQGPCIACPAHAYVFDAGSGRCLTNPSTPDARRHSARWKTWPPYYLCPLICSAALPFDGSRATRGPACQGRRTIPCDPGRYPAWAVETPKHIEVFVSPTPYPRSSTLAPTSREDANAIQLAMVDRALRRRYGDESDECAAESEP